MFDHDLWNFDYIWVNLIMMNENKIIKKEKEFW